MLMPLRDLDNDLPACSYAARDHAKLRQGFQRRPRILERMRENEAVDEPHTVDDPPVIIRHTDEAEEHEAVDRRQRRELLVLVELGFDAADTWHGRLSLDQVRGLARRRRRKEVPAAGGVFPA